MEKSPLQIARAAYQPKLPKALQGPVSAKEGEPTKSVGDQEEIKKLFPNTYGMPVIEFETGEAKELPPYNVGVILSGGCYPTAMYAVAAVTVVVGMNNAVEEFQRDFLTIHGDNASQKVTVSICVLLQLVKSQSQL